MCNPTRVSSIRNGYPAYSVGDRRVFYTRDYRDRKADELEQMGYTIERYDGLVNYFFRVIDVPGHR